MSETRIDFGWGGAGLTALHQRCDVFVIIDMLCFSTSVDVAVSRGAEVLPYPLGKMGAEEAARRGDAVLAKPRREAAGGPSLSPASLLGLAPGTRLLLPSPNGSALSAMVRDRKGFAGCLRNATAVAAAVQQAAGESGGRIAVIAAGEHWPGGALRPAIEDLLGAGAIIARLHGTLSADARAARAAYRDLKDDLPASFRASLSGAELIAAGFPDDVEIAAQEDVSAAVPMLEDGRYRDLADIRAIEPASGTAFALREGTAADDAACGRVVGAAAATSSYAPQLPHAARLLGDRSPLSQDDRRRIVAEAGGTIVGFVEFQHARGHVKYLFVHPDLQGNGIGAALLDAAEAAIAGPVSLTALAANQRGLRWYLRRGYRITGGSLEENWEGGPAVWLALRKDGA